MGTYNIHGGHNFYVTGASGYFDETTEDRKVKDFVVSKLRKLGHTVYDCTDEVGRTQATNLSNIVSRCNSHDVDLDISIHFNASNGEGHGTEVLLYGNGNHRTIGQRIVNSIAELGFKNRGIKDGSNLYVVRNTKAPAILIECCFCDNAEDAKRYKAEAMATAIVKGITGASVNESNNNTNSQFQADRAYIVTADGLNRRSEPNAISHIVGVSPKGYAHAIKAVSGDWGQDVAGYWINLKYTKPYIVEVTADGLNRRSEPNANSKIVGVSPKGYGHRVKAVRNGWGQDIAGYWINLKYTRVR